MRELINDFGPKISDSFIEDSYCSFAPPEETLGYIDTSVKRSAKHGIAFLCDEIVVSFKGTAQRAQYRNIRKVTIGGNVNPYEDELIITTGNSHISITHDCINKLFLKQLLDNLCRCYNFMTERQREDMYSECTSRAMSHFTDEVTEPQKAVKVVKVISRVKTIQPTNEATVSTTPANTSAEATISAKPAILDESDAVAWSLTRDSQAASANSPAPVTTPFEAEAAPTEPLPAPAALSDEENIAVTWSLSREQTAINTDELNLNADDENIDGMTKAQTMSYLLDSISEINSDAADISTPSEPTRKTESAPDATPAQNAVTQHVQQIPPEQPIHTNDAKAFTPTPTPEPIPTPVSSPYTIEPDGNDIYLIASARIREMYENGSLTPELVEQELKANLLITAEEYTRITESGKELPPFVEARAPLLKSATDRLAEYFALGEDIGTRVMLFMMFQMLSYADRIEESEQTKTRLNEFFKRCGSAGVILSMIDSM